jgi:DNA-binding CsgD family transcriptional regulator
MLTTDRLVVDLTAQQRSVVALSATGMGTRDVADLLGISCHEVREHLAAVMLDLGARSKLEAVIIALRRRLIQLPEDQPAD